MSASNCSSWTLIRKGSRTPELLPLWEQENLDSGTTSLLEAHAVTCSPMPCLYRHPYPQSSLLTPYKRLSRTSCCVPGRAAAARRAAGSAAPRPGWRPRPPHAAARPRVPPVPPLGTAAGPPTWMRRSPAPPPRPHCLFIIQFYAVGISSFFLALSQRNVFHHRDTHQGNDEIPP